MLEPNLSPYAPIIDRPVIKWPNNARVALWVAPNVEYMDFDPAPNDGHGGFYRNVYSRTPTPDVASFGLQDYGNRVCFWRMLEVFDQNNIRCTVSLNEAILDMFPETKAAMIKRDYDYMSHGIYNNRFLNLLSIDEERAFFKDCVDSLYRHTGKKLKGMLTPAVSPPPILTTSWPKQAYLQRRLGARRPAFPYEGQVRPPHLNALQPGPQ